MGKSEQQKEILQLGKILVKELDLVKSVDTLSRWMAHYVAEKIKQAEALPNGAKKEKLEKECFFLILELWKNRWNNKADRILLKDFNHLFDVIKRLDPEKEEPFFYRLINSQSKDDNDNSFSPSDMRSMSPLALQMDKVARIWIDYLLRKAAARLDNKKIKKIINNAVKLPDTADVHIIQFVLKDSLDDINKKPISQKEFDRKKKIETLNRRIGELEKFKKINEYLLNEFNKELNSLKK